MVNVIPYEDEDEQMTEEEESDEESEEGEPDHATYLESFRRSIALRCPQVISVMRALVRIANESNLENFTAVKARMALVLDWEDRRNYLTTIIEHNTAGIAPSLREFIHLQTLIYTMDNQDGEHQQLFPEIVDPDQTDTVYNDEHLIQYEEELVFDRVVDFFMHRVIFYDFKAEEMECLFNFLRNN